jgi:hypothetical protein
LSGVGAENKRRRRRYLEACNGSLDGGERAPLFDGFSPKTCVIRFECGYSCAEFGIDLPLLRALLVQRIIKDIQVPKNP